MAFYGADVTALRALGKSFDEASGELDDLRTRISQRLGSVDWKGPDAEHFRDLWSSQCASALTTTRDALREAGTALVRNADHQEVTSEDNGPGGTSWGGGTPGGGSTSGPGGGPVIGPAGPLAPGSPWGLHGGTGGAAGEKVDNSGVFDPHRNYQSTYQLSTLDGEQVDGPLHDDKRPVDAKAHLASANASGVLGVQGEMDGSFGESSGFHGDGSLAGWAGARADAGAGGYVGADGLAVEGQAGVAVGAGGKADGSLGYGILEANGSAEAFAGARAGVDAAASVGPDGLGVAVGAEAFAGAEAKVEASVGIEGAQVGAEATGYAGIGVRANVDVKAGWEHTEIDIDLGVALGLGGGVGLKVDLEPKKLVEGLTDLLPW